MEEEEFDPRIPVELSSEEDEENNLIQEDDVDDLLALLKEKSKKVEEEFNEDPEKFRKEFNEHTGRHDSVETLEKMGPNTLTLSHQYPSSLGVLTDIAKSNREEIQKKAGPNADILEAAATYFLLHHEMFEKIAKDPEMRFKAQTPSTPDRQINKSAVFFITTTGSVGFIGRSGNLFQNVIKGGNVERENAWFMYVPMKFRKGERDPKKVITQSSKISSGVPRVGESLAYSYTDPKTNITWSSDPATSPLTSIYLYDGPKSDKELVDHIKASLNTGDTMIWETTIQQAKKTVVSRRDQKK